MLYINRLKPTQTKRMPLCEFLKAFFQTQKEEYVKKASLNTLTAMFGAILIFQKCSKMPRWHPPILHVHTQSFPKHQKCLRSTKTQGPAKNGL